MKQETVKIIAEQAAGSLGDEFQVADCVYAKIEQSGGYRYKNARRPELYREILGQEHVSEQKVVWKDK